MKPTIVLLHGLARTHRSMAWLQAQLEAAGHPTWAETYPSRRRSIRELAAYLEERISGQLGDRPLVAVTHSLGGILVRNMTRLKFESVVMLAPPNQGSRVAAALRDLSLYRFFYGPAGRDVTEPADWPAAPGNCGVIAGTRSRSAGNPTSWLATSVGLLPKDEPGDGTLLVEETHLAGLSDFTTVDASHTWIVRHPDVPPLILRFLEHGRFADEARPARGSERRLP